MTGRHTGGKTPGVDYRLAYRTQVRPVCLKCGWSGPWRLTVAQATELIDRHDCNIVTARRYPRRHG